ncbi:MAG TPA: gamma-glutamyltransferase [Sphingobacteriaceae bacterium]
MKLLLFSLILFITLFPNSGFTQGEIYKNGVVVSAHPEASRVGLHVLKKGGNAIDAAVAVQFALAVVYPSAGNIGGGGFLVYRSAKGEINSLDFREKAPHKATKAMFLDENGQVNKDKSLYGHLAAGVPGSVDGMVKAHKKYGKLSWRELLDPAINLAENGFPITSKQAHELNGMKNEFITYNPGSIPFVKPSGNWQSGDLLIQKDLSHTLKLIRDKGRAGFYEGEIARIISEEMMRGKGLISEKDLKEYQSVWRTPITGQYKNYRIISMPPPSSGGIALVQLLQSVQPYPLKRWGFNTDSTVQLMVEAERRVYADRSVYLGDPDFFKVPKNQLLNPSYQKNRLSNFNWDKATLSSDIQEGVLSGTESEETTHFSIVDREGNAASVTTTLNGSFGSLVVVQKGGFLLNNEMDDFSAKPGSPNMYGLLGGEANAIEPGKRMLSSMTPTILEKDSKLFMVVGTPGGSTIITSVFQTILNVIEFDMPIQQAVSAKRFHHQWMPDIIHTEREAIDSKSVSILQNKGFKLVPRSPIGRVDAILITDKGYMGGADPRGDDSTSGW